MNVEAAEASADENKIPATERPTSKKRKARNINAVAVAFNNKFFHYICPSTFNAKRFAKGHEPVYVPAAMKKIEETFNNQLGFNFDLSRAA